MKNQRPGEDKRLIGVLLQRGYTTMEQITKELVEKGYLSSQEVDDETRFSAIDKWVIDNKFLN